MLFFSFLNLEPNVGVGAAGAAVAAAAAAFKATELPVSAMGVNESDRGCRWSQERPHQR